MIPLRTKGSQEMANAFLANVLARFSAPAEVVSDGGTEFQGAFAALLEQCFIDHRVTSPNHPQANGAAQRVVQICKRALRKYCAEQSTTAAWVDYLPWILLGYRCSAQASTGKSPFELMYGAPPMVPVGTRHVFEAPLNPDQEPHQADQLLRLRADAVQQAATAVGINLLIAQHRDQHRYARVRAGGYKPRFTNFMVGDYVYVMLRNRNNTLQLPARETILRIVDVSDAGVATVIGRDGTSRKEHVSNLVPCHLQDIDPIVDPCIAIPPLDLACEVCAFPGDGRNMLLCDSCGTGWHLHCLTPLLKRVPGGTWTCPP
ncbi:hypothetical protein GPECTOR_529g524 [Gonium pectorale]|uniref:Integrase catalytic domain-containing protein n=1 Tax=Gonium pectorale TaxID=33097 RepID=A0A150FUS7_GONPE|nr:hypothetical protein GPECTOR_529g524 [Gonium pectorale]|eukprot:KXZ41347.1 hypothetical protein GPECTOR_529g524 [Gonium pectorale]